MGKGSNLKDELEDSSSKKIKSTSSSTSLENGTNDDKTKDPLKTFYTWEEVKMHNTKTDSWVVVNDNVYNLTNFKNKHPGGSRIINHFAGQDASVYIFIYIIINI
jgi:cytochrome b involved in lipid metabolism